MKSGLRTLASFFVIGLCLGYARPASAQLADADTLLYLNFNNTLNGAAGETAAIASNTSFTSGISGAGTVISSNTVLAYAAANNINAQNGTLEFFLKPNWNGSANETHTLLSWGTDGGMLFTKDSAPNLRQIANRYIMEAGTAVSGNILSANTWYNIAYTWNSTDKNLKLYVDGVLRDTESFGINLPTISGVNFYIGSDDGTTGTTTAQGTIDELRISNRERSATEINAYRNAVLASPAAPEPGTLPLLAGGICFGSGLLKHRRRK